MRKKFFDKRTKNYFDKTSEPLPWEGKESIYDFIQQQLVDYGKIVNVTLPDEEEFTINDEIRFVSGAQDHLMGGFFSKSKQQQMARKLVKLVKKLVEDPNNITRRSVYLKVIEEHTIEFIDAFLDSLKYQKWINDPVLHKEALWFVKNSSHRGAVKFGIAVLGVLDCEKDKEILLTIGKHEEFTLYAAVAIQNGTDAPNENLLQLAKSVDGWGKISVVERLKPSTQEIKDWLVTQGCENSIMNEYLAYIAAVKGDLHKVLDEQEIQYKMFRGASIIISALINGGPAEDIDDYEHASFVLDGYLYHAEKHCQSLDEYETILDIYDFINDEDENWEERFANGWKRGQREKLRINLQKWMKDEKWKQRALETLEGKNENLYAPLRIARFFSIDVWPILFNKLSIDPLNDLLYFELMQTDDKNRVLKLVEFAEKHFPIEKMKTGPALDLGLGEEYNHFSCLDFIVQDLDRFQGVGISLLEVALQSPVMRNRNMALNTLEQWSKELWEKEYCRELVKELSKKDPDEEIRERARELMRGLG